MKFLIFNAAVIAALAYLLTGGEISVAPMLDKARGLVSETAVKTSSLPAVKASPAPAPKRTVEAAPIVEAPKPIVGPKREPLPAPTVIAKASPDPSFVPIPASTPKPAPFVADDKDGLPLIDVEREVARVEPKMAPKPAPASVVATAPPPQFMNPSERRRELIKLARSMEDMFLRHSASD